MQLDLFSKPSAEVVAFPSWRRRDLVVEVARTLRQKQGKAADRHWRSVARSVVADLVAVGVSRRVAEAEARGLFDAVQGEMVWMALDQPARPGGAR